MSVQGNIYESVLIAGGTGVFVLASESLIEFPPFIGGENAVGHFAGLILGGGITYTLFRLGSRVYEVVEGA
jgi:hypothetical protein